MKELKVGVLIVLFFMIISCEPHAEANIQNYTKEAITIKIKFDKEVLESNWHGLPYIDFLKTHPEPPLLFDSINLINTYKVYPNSKFKLYSALEREPHYDLFEHIEIVGGDTILWEDKEAIKNAFTNIGNVIWEFKIK